MDINFKILKTIKINDKDKSYIFKTIFYDNHMLRNKNTKKIICLLATHTYY